MIDEFIQQITRLESEVNNLQATLAAKEAEVQGLRTALNIAKADVDDLIYNITENPSTTFETVGINLEAISEQAAQALAPEGNDGK